LFAAGLFYEVKTMDDRDLTRLITLIEDIVTVELCLVTVDYALDAQYLTVPFGKYKDKLFGQVPLRYLDQTFSTMPKTWLIRMAILFVDVCMMKVVDEIGDEYFLGPPDKCWNELKGEIACLNNTGKL